MWKWIVGIIVVVALAGGGWYYYQNVYLPQQTAAAAASYETYAVGRGSISSTVSATGSISMTASTGSISLTASAADVTASGLNVKCTGQIGFSAQGTATAEVSARAGDIPAELPVADVPRPTLRSYAGTYETPAGPLAVAVADEGQMTVKLGGQPAIPVLAVTQTEFRLVGVDARVEFKSEGGKVTGAVIRQSGRELPAKRVD